MSDQYTKFKRTLLHGNGHRIYMSEKIIEYLYVCMYIYILVLHPVFSQEFKVTYMLRERDCTDTGWLKDR